MDGLFHGKYHLEMDDNWGYPYFRKPTVDVSGVISRLFPSARDSLVFIRDFLVSVLSDYVGGCCKKDEPAVMVRSLVGPMVEKIQIRASHGSSHLKYTLGPVLIKIATPRWLVNTTVDGPAKSGYHQLIGGKHPIIYRRSTIRLVVQDFATIHPPYQYFRLQTHQTIWVTVVFLGSMNWFPSGFKFQSSSNVL